MATSKASSSRGKHIQHAKVTNAMFGNDLYYGFQNAVLKSGTSQPAKLIVLKVNPKLDKVAKQPLNNKASAAKEIFAKYRKNH